MPLFEGRSSPYPPVARLDQSGTSMTEPIRNGTCLNLHNSIDILHNILEDSHKVVGQDVLCKDGIEK